MNCVTSDPTPEAIIDDANAAGVNAVALTRLLANARSVQRRHQFYGWTQTCMVGLLPHKVLACGSYQRSRRELSFEVFNTVVLGKTLQAELSDARSELLRGAVSAWLTGGSRARWVNTRDIVRSEPLADDLVRAQVSRVLVHGVSRPQRPSELETFFVFADLAWSQMPGDLACLEMLLPCLHITYLRVLAMEQMLGTKASTPRASASRSPLGMLTVRELQVLACVREGMRNVEIGQALGISALTAKNHIQSILRKLGASSRAHAVAKAETMRALGAPVDASQGDAVTDSAPMPDESDNRNQ